jgi:hypothetical protein
LKLIKENLAFPTLVLAVMSIWAVFMDEYGISILLVLLTLALYAVTEKE